MAPSPAGQASLNLILTDTRDGQRRTVSVSRKVLSFGSGADSSIVLRGKDVASRHCVIEPGPDGCFAVDLHTETGTLLNGRPFDRARIQAGDVLRLGPYQIVVTEGGTAAVASGERSEDPFFDEDDQFGTANKGDIPPSVRENLDRIRDRRERSQRRRALFSVLFVIATVAAGSTVAWNLWQENRGQRQRVEEFTTVYQSACDAIARGALDAAEAELRDLLARDLQPEQQETVRSALQAVARRRETERRMQAVIQEASDLIDAGGLEEALVKLQEVRIESGTDSPVHRQAVDLMDTTTKRLRARGDAGDLYLSDAEVSNRLQQVDALVLGKEYSKAIAMTSTLRVQKDEHKQALEAARAKVETAAALEGDDHLAFIEELMHSGKLLVAQSYLAEDQVARYRGTAVGNRMKVTLDEVERRLAALDVPDALRLYSDPTAHGGSTEVSPGPADSTQGSKTDPPRSETKVAPRNEPGSVPDSTPIPPASGLELFEDLVRKTLDAADSADFDLDQLTEAQRSALPSALLQAARQQIAELQVSGELEALRALFAARQRLDPLRRDLIAFLEAAGPALDLNASAEFQARLTGLRQAWGVETERAPEPRVSLSKKPVATLDHLRWLQQLRTRLPAAPDTDWERLEDGFLAFLPRNQTILTVRLVGVDAADRDRIERQLQLAPQGRVASKARSLELLLARELNQYRSMLGQAWLAWDEELYASASAYKGAGEGAVVRIAAKAGITASEARAALLGKPREHLLALAGDYFGVAALQDNGFWVLLLKKAQ